MEDIGNGSTGLTFSQDLTSIFSQTSNATQDATRLSESISQASGPPPSSQSTFSNGCSGSQDSGVFDQLLPRHPLPPAFPLPSKNARPNAQGPRWTKALLKTAEENGRQKEIENMMRRQDEDNRQIKTLLQETNAASKSNPVIVSRIVKESTDFIISNVNKQLAKLQDDVMEGILKRCQELKQQSEDQLFEILTNISATKEKVLTKSSEDFEKSKSDIVSLLDDLKEFVKQRVNVSAVDELKKFIDDKMEKIELPTSQTIPSPIYTSTPKLVYGRFQVEESSFGCDITPEK